MADPLQADLTQQTGLDTPKTDLSVDWSKARPAFPQAAKAAPQPVEQAGQEIDWSKARPAFPNQTPNAAQPAAQQDQGIVGNAIDWADKYLTRKSADNNSPLQSLAMIAQPALGATKGAAETLHTVGALGSHALKAAGLDVPDISFDEPQYLEAHGTGQTIGKVGEGVLEFFLGDEALKGATMAEKLKQATKLTEFMESSPRLAAALTTGIGALRMGAVSAAQTGAHGGTADQALESGLTTGAIGGGLSGLGAIARTTASPMLARLAIGAEVAGGTALAGKGAVSAFTPQQENETPQQSLERRVNGVVQGILGTYGAAEAAGSAGSNQVAARARQTANWVNDIEKDTFWASPTSKGKTAGSTPEALTYRETIRAALPQLLEVIKDNPTASTPKDMSRAIQSRIDGVEGRLQRVAESTQGYEQATLHNVEDDFRKAADDFYKQNKGAYKKDVFDKAVDETVGRLRQGEGDEPRDPNLFESENLRQQLNAETGEAPDRSSATNALKQVAVRLLRDKIDQGYEDLGVQNVKEWRQQEANLIKVKDQIALGEKAMETANKTPLLTRLLRSAGWGGIGLLFGGPFGTATGLTIGGGLEAGSIIRDYMENHENNPETKINRVIKTAGKLEGRDTGLPDAVTPQFTGTGVLPKVVPASVPNDSAAGVIRDTGSLRQAPPPEAPLEIAQAMEGTGLQFIGTDGMGLSHFHDPRTNNTLSIPTEKVTQDLLLSKLADKAEADKKNKPAVPYIASNPQVAAAEKNFVKSLVDYNNAKREMAKSDDKLAAQAKVREAAQNSIDAQDQYAKLREAWRQTQRISRLESDQKYIDNFKPMIEGDTPHKVIPEAQASPVRETMTHEYGHAALESLFPDLAKAGVKVTQIQANSHPDLANEPGVLAAAKIDYGELVRPDGYMNLDKVQYHLGDLMQMSAMGGAAEEILHGTKIKDNEGLQGDIDYMKHYMNALDVPEETQKMMIDRSFELAKQRLKTAGVKEVLEKYSYGREQGLTDVNLHASRQRVQAMNDEIKSVLENPNAGNSTRTTGQNGGGNTKAASSTESKAAATVPPANVKRADSTGGEAATLREQTDKSLEGSIRAMGLRQLIAQIGDKLPLEKSRLQAELAKQEQANRQMEEGGVVPPTSIPKTDAAAAISQKQAKDLTLDDVNSKGRWFINPDGSAVGSTGGWLAEHSHAMNSGLVKDGAVRVVDSNTFDISEKPTEDQMAQVARLARESGRRLVTYEIWPPMATEPIYGEGTIGELQRTIDKHFPEENTGQTRPSSGILKSLGVATGLGALAGVGLKAQDKQALPDGMVKVGNIDVNHRPIIHNDDGGVSTIFSTTIPLDKDGNVWTGTYETAPQYALVPTIANGKFLTSDGKLPKELLKTSKATPKEKQDATSALEDAATEYYEKTKEHLGIFKSEKAANDFAEKTHSWLATGGPEKVYLPPSSNPEIENRVRKATKK